MELIPTSDSWWPIRTGVFLILFNTVELAPSTQPWDLRGEGKTGWNQGKRLLKSQPGLRRALARPQHCLWPSNVCLGTSVRSWDAGFLTGGRATSSPLRVLSGPSALTAQVVRWQKLRLSMPELFRCGERLRYWKRTQGTHQGRYSHQKGQP